MSRKSVSFLDKTFQLIESISSLRPIVCLGKGEVAVNLVEKFTDRVLVVDRNFSSYYISFGLVREVWGSVLAPAPWKKPSKLIADFSKIEFRENSIGAIFFLSFS